MAKKVKGADRESLILHLLREFPNNKFSIKHIASSTGGNTREGRRETMAILERLEREGAVDLVGRDKYRLGSRMRPCYQGVVDMTSSGDIYVKVDELERDVFVRREDSMNALEGDIVEVAVMHTSKSGENDGEVVSIVERSDRNYVGVASIDHGAIFVSCDPRRLPVDIYMPRKFYPKVEEGDKLVVKILDWREGSKSPEGVLIENLGPSGSNDTEMHAILAEYDLPYKFDPMVEREAGEISSEISESERASRRDFSDVVTFTIDPKDAKDFDDALSVRKLEEGVWEVGVHIADVTHYVKPGSLIDQEALERGTSVYLVDRTVPMLPERLCNELCSLRPNEHKCCFSAVFNLNEQCDVLDQWFGRTIIYSDRRFTYEEAQQIIQTGKGDYADEVLTLHRLAQRLREARFKAGAVAFAREEMKFDLDSEGRPIGVYFKEQKEANQLIEEFMLLANRKVAEWCAYAEGKSRKTPRTMVYRVHDDPSEEKLERFRSFVLRFGHIFKAQKGRAVAKEMNKLLRNIDGSPEQNAVTTLAVRSMSKACYSTDNVGHYGLAFDYYTHFTSPIRRYPDMMVHRLLARYLDSKNSAERRKYEELCDHCNDRELLAAEAERASIKYKAVEFLAGKVGEEFVGHVSGLAERGIYVEIDDNHIEGMLFLRDMTDDFYRFDEERYEIYGHSSRRVITLGIPLRIRVKNADMKRRVIDFELVEYL